MNNKKIDIDQLFNSRLSEAEEAFDPNAWEQMHQKLDENDSRKGGFVLFPNKSNKIKTITIMSIIIASAVAIGLYNYSPLQNTENTVATVNVSKQNNTVANANPTKSTNENTAKYNTGISKKLNNVSANTSSYNTSYPMTLKIAKQSAASSIFKPYSDKTITRQTQNFLNTITPISYDLLTDEKPEIAKSNPDSLKLVRLLIGNKRYRYDKPWIGIHLTGMMPLGALRDSGYRPGIGMNLELMSGDVLKAKYTGVSFGGSMGFLWNGQSRKQNVTLATPNNDSGYTKLYNMGFHFDFIARVELGNFRLKPYFDGVLGVRNLTTFQSVNSYQTIQGYQSTDNSMLSSWTLQYGMSAGLRWHWVPGVSVDLRGTWYSGANVNFIDVKHTPFNPNTASFNAKVHNAPGDMFTLRLGLLFDLDEMNSSQKNNYNTNTTSIYQRNGTTPVYDNRNRGNGNTGSNNGGRVGGSSGRGSSGGTPLKIKVPSPAPVGR